MSEMFSVWQRIAKNMTSDALRYAIQDALDAADACSFSQTYVARKMDEVSVYRAELTRRKQPH